MGDQTYPLGIDVGGSGIKGAPVDLDKGEFATDRLRIETPENSTPQNVVEVIAQVVAEFEEQTAGQPIGITVPAVVSHGVVKTAANIDTSWIDTDAESLLRDKIGRHVTVLNDADAAGVAEMHFGSGRGISGTVIMATLGTGIGTAVFVDGILVPNTELGHLEIDGHDAETRAANSARKDEDLSWEEWAKRLALLRPPGGPAVARSHHHRRRGQQEGAEVPAAARPADPDHPGGAAERRRDHRRRLAGRAGLAGLSRARRPRSEGDGPRSEGDGPLRGRRACPR